MEHAFIREAKAEDSHFLAWVILAASRGHLSKGWFDIALNLPEEKCLLFLSRLTTSNLISRWHYSRFLIVECAAHAAAALCAFRSADAFLISPTAITQIAQEMDLPRLEHAAIWQRGAYQFTCSSRSDDDDWILESIATAVEYRGRRYTSMLLVKALELGMARGLPRAEITLTIGNTSAECVYQKAGFKIVDERRHPTFEAMTGAPGLRKLVRELRPHAEKVRIVRTTSTE